MLSLHLLGKIFWFTICIRLFNGVSNNTLIIILVIHVLTCLVMSPRNLLLITTDKTNNTCIFNIIFSFVPNLKMLVIVVCVWPNEVCVQWTTIIVSVFLAIYRSEHFLSIWFDIVILFSDYIYIFRHLCII